MFDSQSLPLFEQGLQQLHVARRILGYSYAFAYYMFGGEMFKEQVSEEQNRCNQHLFEDAQERMESEVCPPTDPPPPLPAYSYCCPGLVRL